MDEMYCTNQGRYYFAIRIQYVNRDFQLETHLLSQRHFDRSMMPTDIMAASQILYDWFRGVLKEFGN